MGNYTREEILQMVENLSVFSLPICLGQSKISL